jgi:hypothetical protein
MRLAANSQQNNSLEGFVNSPATVEFPQSWVWILLYYVQRPCYSRNLSLWGARLTIQRGLRRDRLEFGLISLRPTALERAERVLGQRPARSGHESFARSLIRYAPA